MRSALERARAAQSKGQQDLELGKRTLDLYYGFFLWNDVQPGTSLIEVVIPEFSEIPRSCRTRFPIPIEPNEQGERSRWVFSITSTSFHERVILVHYQYWEPGVSEKKQPSYTETYKFINGVIFTHHSTNDVDRDKATEICNEIALLIGKQEPTGSAFAPRQPKGEKR